MITGLYLQRTLRSGDDQLHEAQLPQEPRVIVVLAEPGAGKTRLLQSIARRLGVRSVPARMFKSLSYSMTGGPLVIDGLDEVAKLDECGLDDLIIKASNSGAKRVVMASRSSEWEEARTHFVEACFSEKPLLVHLAPLSIEEQKALFQDRHPNEDYHTFQEQVERFDLAPLNGNPLFLELFAGAFIEGDRQFTNKKSVFQAAVKRLAYEGNSGQVQKGTVSLNDRISWSAQVFAVLLLSGAEGVTLVDTLSDRHFPSLSELMPNRREVSCILDSRLFTPADEPNSHIPVHRVVAEYCAAVYLAERIDDTQDPLTLGQCLAVIAPNSTVRDELRGLLGWLAAVGGGEIQRTVIRLDPYAVLANGDPSQLSRPSKKLLLSELEKLSGEDPYFRRGDLWRSFNIAGFFTHDLVDDLRPLLLDQHANRQLRWLVLDLLTNSPAVGELASELANLELSQDENAGLRFLAAECLLGADSHDHQADVYRLLKLGDPTSLEICAKKYQALGVSSLGRDGLRELLSRCAELWPSANDELDDRLAGSRIFVKRLIGTLEAHKIEWLLDELTRALHCYCGAKSDFECHCRDGISKIIGYLLDQFFETSTGPYDASKIYAWVRNLLFHNSVDQTRSPAVRVLQTDHSLRRSIHARACDDAATRAHHRALVEMTFTPHMHAGLHVQPEDRLFLAQHAFKTGNTRQWISCRYTSVNPESSSHAIVCELRRLMRSHTRQSQKLLEAWAQDERLTKKWEAMNKRRSVLLRKRQARENKAFAKSREGVAKNRTIIEQGRDRHFLWVSVYHLLNDTEYLEKAYTNLALARSAFRNCLPHIQLHIPSLEAAARSRLGVSFHTSEAVLLAACIEIFRHRRSLDSVDQAVLEIVKVNLGTHFTNITKEIELEIEREVDKRLFQNNSDKISFLRRFLETQLDNSSPNSSSPSVGWLLRKPIFSSVAGALALEWLTKYPQAGVSTLGALFDTAMADGHSDELERLVVLNTQDFLSAWPDYQEDDQANSCLRFWLLRRFYFARSIHPNSGKWLQSDENIVFAFERISGPLYSSDHASWPSLDSQKIHLILDTYIEVWPPVHLPSSWGTSSPYNETAFRFLNDLVWHIGNDQPERSLSSLNKMLEDSRFLCFQDKLKTMKRTATQAIALRNFEAPSPAEIVGLLQRNGVTTVEVLRAILLQELQSFQQEIDGGDFNTVSYFYDGGQRVSETTATERIADWLNQRLRPMNISVAIERQFKNQNRCDITAEKMLRGERKMIVIEAKGQWHKDLFSAASKQLDSRYAIHPDAEEQGIYLVLWYGPDTEVARRKKHGIQSADDLKVEIEGSLDDSLRGRIDVFVLDLSGPPKC